MRKMSHFQEYHLPVTRSVAEHLRSGSRHSGNEGGGKKKKIRRDFLSFACSSTRPEWQHADTLLIPPKVVGT